MTTHQESQHLSEIAVKPTFRIIDGVSIRFVESEPRDSDALLLSPWPGSASWPTGQHGHDWRKLHIWLRSTCRGLAAPRGRTR